MSINLKHLMAGFQSVSRMHVLLFSLCLCLCVWHMFCIFMHVNLIELIESFSLEICSCAHIRDVCEHMENIHRVMHMLVNKTLHHVTVMHANTKQHNEEWTLHSQCWRCSSIDRQCTILHTQHIHCTKEREGKNGLTTCLDLIQIKTSLCILLH